MSPNRIAGPGPQRAPRPIRPIREVACGIYCLVRQAGQVDLAVERLKLAGAAGGDIKVVLREESAPTPAIPPREEECPPAPWWSLPLCAALWWPLAFYAPPTPGAEAVAAAEIDGADAVVVFLDLYRARRRR